VAVWLDREQIRPGERWQIAIRRAIEDGAFFVACFSAAHAARDRSYMNVELAIAVEQLGLRPTDRSWFIPVLFEGGEIPDRPIGGGETLRDIQWVDLTQDWNDGIQRILSVVRPVVTVAPLPKTPQHVVVMMADIVGSTSLATNLDQTAFFEIMRTITKTVAEAAKKHAGRLMRIEGDSFVAVFDTANEAVACALDLQRSITELGVLQNSGLRIGLAAGPVLEIQNDLVGAVVNLAARVCSLAGAGQILVSAGVVMVGLSQHVLVIDLGPMVMKGFPERVYIFEIRRVEP
jgi:class 3 adenylate cyclase